MLATVVIALVTAFLLGHRAWAWWRLRHIRGPLFAGFSDLWMLRRVLAGTLYEDLGDVCNEYGKCRRRQQSNQYQR